MLSVWNWILDTCIRDLSMEVRIIISVVIFALSVLCFIMAVKRKNDSMPLGLGWVILCILFLVISGVYLFV